MFRMTNELQGLWALARYYQRAGRYYEYMRCLYAIQDTIPEASELSLSIKSLIAAKWMQICLPGNEEEVKSLLDRCLVLLSDFTDQRSLYFRVYALFYEFYFLTKEYNYAKIYAKQSIDYALSLSFLGQCRDDYYDALLHYAKLWQLDGKLIRVQELQTMITVALSMAEKMEDDLGYWLVASLRFHIHLAQDISIRNSDWSSFSAARSSAMEGYRTIDPSSYFLVSAYHNALSICYYMRLGDGRHAYRAVLDFNADLQSYCSAIHQGSPCRFKWMPLDELVAFGNRISSIVLRGVNPLQSLRHIHTASSLLKSKLYTLLGPLLPRRKAYLVPASQLHTIYDLSEHWCMCLEVEVLLSLHLGDYVKALEVVETLAICQQSFLPLERAASFSHRIHYLMGLYAMHVGSYEMAIRHLMLCQQRAMHKTDQMLGALTTCIALCAAGEVIQAEGLLSSCFKEVTKQPNELLRAVLDYTRCVISVTKHQTAEMVPALHRVSRSACGEILHGGLAAHALVLAAEVALLDSDMDFTASLLTSAYKRADILQAASVLHRIDALTTQYQQRISLEEENMLEIDEPRLRSTTASLERARQGALAHRRHYLLMQLLGEG